MSDAAVGGLGKQHILCSTVHKSYSKFTVPCRLKNILHQIILKSIELILAADTFKGDSPSTSIVDAESFQRKFNSFQFPSKNKAII